MAIAVDRTESDGVSIVQVTGEVDVMTAPALADELVKLAESKAALVVVDLERVSFLDSTGLGVLVNGRKQITAAGGKLAVACASGRLSKLFSITGLNEILEVKPDLAAAVQAVSS